jgi:glycosyltransferase involved in cell wall biosynthesis
MNLPEKITVVVPCKNEQDYIAHLLRALRAQQIGNTRVIIADCSTDRTREVIAAEGTGLNIEVIPGGPVSVAKNRGAQLVTTPYILFIDADVRFFKPGVILTAVECLESEDLDLIGLRVRSYDKNPLAHLGFALFNVVNGVLKRKTPFAVGAFMLTRRDKFWEYGGFSETLSTSEDFFLSRQYPPHKFALLNEHFGQDSRRFKKMGYFGMAKYLVQNYINRDNPEYWRRLDNTKYWN